MRRNRLTRPAAGARLTRVATQADVRRIALSLPEVMESDDRFAFGLPHRGSMRGIAWVWMERVDPKKARVPNDDVLVVRVASETDKRELIASAPDVYFTESHYDGYAAVLVRLAAIELDELRELLTDAWRLKAPKRLVMEHDGRSSPDGR